MQDLINHLWQSTMFAIIVAILTVALRKNQARTRYWLWLAASIKFLIPFSLLVDAGTRVDPPILRSNVPAVAVERISTTFAPMPIVPPKVRLSRLSPMLPWPTMFTMLWIAGVLVLLTRWLFRWRAIQSVRHHATLVDDPAPIAIVSARTSMEPGVIGIFKPILLLPEGIRDNLNQDQLDAIIAHELSHVRYRDNLTAAVHMVVETLFWFHPLVWWIGARLVAEREQACDESVLQQGSPPQVYAEGILNVCKFYVESRLKCAAGVTGGAELKKRIAQIMTQPCTSQLTLAGKLMLTASGVAVVAIPFALGILRAQTLPPEPKFTYEVATVKPSRAANDNSRIMPGPQGGMRCENTRVIQLMAFAYGSAEYLFYGGPEWVKTDRFDVSFTPDRAEAAPDPSSSRTELEGFIGRQRQRMQLVLRDRFGLVLRAESRQMPMYALVQAKGGHKLKIAKSGGPPRMRFGRDQLSGVSAVIPMLVSNLGRSSYLRIRQVYA